MITSSIGSLTLSSRHVAPSVATLSSSVQSALLRGPVTTARFVSPDVVAMVRPPETEPAAGPPVGLIVGGVVLVGAAAAAFLLLRGGR